MTRHPAAAARASAEEITGETTAEASVQVPRESEKSFQARVVALAQTCHWATYHTWNSLHSAAGFPDLVLVRRRRAEAVGRVIFAELKTARGKVSAAQRAWLDALANTNIDRVEVYVWRPADFEQIVKVLA